MDHHIDAHSAHKDPAYVQSGGLVDHVPGEAESCIEQYKRCKLVEELQALEQFTVERLVEHEVDRLNHGQKNQDEDEQGRLL